ncbi:MAG: alpha-galactosidase [Chloroflexi bacterium]|nr:alpha-galactosidase [Chloroflexota bacterium]
MSEVRFRETARGPVLTSDSLRLAVHLDEGTFAVSEAQTGRAVMPHVASSVLLTDGSTLSTRGAGFVPESARRIEDPHGGGLALALRRRWHQSEPELTLTLTLYDTQPFAVLQAGIENTTDAPLRVQAFHVLEGSPLRLGADPRAWRFYKEGWQNWTPALVLPCSGEDIYMAPPVIGPTTQPAPWRGRFLSELVTAVVDPATGRGLTAGFVSAADQFSQLWLDRGRRAITAASYADGIEVPPGASLASERLLLEPTRPDGRPPGRTPLESLQRYGDALAKESGAVPWPHVVSGWCSWYYYWQGVREETVLENLEFLAAHRDEMPVEYVQIDDGYQAGIGDWLTPNEKFPHGMGWLAEQVHARGFKAGLWLAPFMIGADSRLWQEHPDWAVRYKPGRPYVAMVNWSQQCYAMDLTRPDAIEWLDRVFRTVFDAWGYDYVKIDFLYAGAVDGIRHDPNVTRAQAYRRGIETIRRAARDRFILGCGNPVAPSIGIVNGTRIGPDVAPFWYPAEPPREPGRSDLSLVSTLNGIRNILSRFWMHGRLWLNDPDCLLARDSETALSADEVRTLATVIGLSGGMMLDSDNLPRLSDERRRRIVSFLLPPYGKSAAPLDLFESEMPRLFELDCGSHNLLGVFNWRDEPAEVMAPLPAEATHVFEVWGRQYLGSHSGTLALSLPKHGCKLVGLRPALERPQVVGSTFHFAQGALEVESEAWDAGTLRLSLRPVACRRGELFVHTPSGWGRPSLEAGGDTVMAVRADGLLALELTLDRPLELSLRFAKG